MAAAFPLTPGSMIGVLGGGQLGRMLALAAARLGLDVTVLEPQSDCPASRVCARTLTAPYDDPGALDELARTCQVVTFEFENVPARVVERLEAFGAVTAPGRAALATAQDRLVEKSFLRAQGLGVADFAQIDTADDLRVAIARLGARALLKTRREGYDGKGQTWVQGAADAEAAFARLNGRPSILEAAAPFVRELSVIAARGRDGTVACYPLGENHHEGGVLRTTLAPALVSPRTAADAEAIARTVLGALDYVGVIGVELFELEDGALLVNEFAPRVHNSGHWTLDGCEVDQFEQHIRAIAGWPLGPTAPLAAVEMENLLGFDAERWAEIAADPRARLWLYGKREARPGRKMGHVNRLRPLG
ncbi:MAG TPA: 5-(carboxyamino)imidazole ribonucleotide synthase [Caulobacteraceae bacterium]|nr:5-(carboxyamino)imidazole ribonucleotide synthase [Caulobacteraceae bacterium]